MESPMQAIGFSHVESEEALDDIVTTILDKPSRQRATNIEKDKILAEYIKDFGEDISVLVRIAVEEDGESPNLQVEHCEPCLHTAYTTEAEEVDVESVDDGYTYYVVCEEKETGMQFVFWLSNVVEYLEAVKAGKKFYQVKVSGLATEGTIILPVVKDEEEESMEKEEKEKLKEMLQRARDGDEEALAQLEKEEEELDELLKERLREEDFLSVMNGYFIPTTLVDATYAILGNIVEMKKITNHKTKEQMYKFLLDVNDMLLEVMVNADTLVGLPSVGMRFMGTCWLQGSIVIPT